MKKRRSFVNTEFKTREEGSQKIIEGYFIVFNQPTELWRGFYEEVSPEAIGDLDDVKVLWNHNQDIVLAWTRNQTAELKKDGHGVWASVIVNEKDSDAMNAYERINRGDVAGCSFGFELVREEYTNKDNGETLATIRELNLFEVSPCVFPAYPQTTISARKKDYQEEQTRSKKARASNLLKKIGGTNGS